MMKIQLTAIIERDRDGYVALCPELDIASQGNSVPEARDNLKEALELFFEVTLDTKIERCRSTDASLLRAPERSKPHGTIPNIVRRSGTHAACMR